MKITLDDNHIYHLEDGRTPPSVSAILDIFIPPSPFYTEEGRDNGRIRHEWYGHLIQGLPADEPEEKFVGAVNGFKKFLQEVKPVYLSGEIPYFHPTLNYCGQPDIVCEINKRLSVVDCKPKTKQKRTIAQTAGYFSLLHANGIKTLDRYELRMGNGIYRLELHPDNYMDVKRFETMAAAVMAAGFYK